MGGYGSGRRGWKPKASEFSRFDLRRLARGGFLSPGRYSTWTWSRNGEPTGSINVRAEFGRVILSYRHRHRWEDEWHDAEDAVPLEWSRCNYGGERVWFRCPRCHRRIAVLYGPGPFACRCCRNLAYDSQNETAHSRALSKTQAIRVRLGGAASLLENFPAKPNRMHWRTYWRLRAKAEDAESRSWPPWVFKMVVQNSTQHRKPRRSP